MRLLDVVTRDPLLKLTALVLAFLLWALVETGNRTGSGVAPQPVPADSGESEQGRGAALDTRSFPVAVRFTGRPVPGWELAGPPRIEPPQLTVRGPVAALQRIDSLHLPVIRLNGRMGSETLDVQVDTTGLGVETVTPARVRVIIPLRQIPSNSSGGGFEGRPDPASAPTATGP